MEMIERALELRERLVALEEEKRNIEQELYSLRRTCEPTARYGGLKPFIEKDYRDWNGMVFSETVRLVDYLLNDEERETHMKIFGQINGSWEELRRSCTYYRNEYGVLSHTGGGWILLQDGIPCSDEEWEAIKSGDIPEKFKTGNLK